MRKLLICSAACALAGCGPSTTTFHNFLVSQVTIACQMPYNCCGATPILTRQFGPDFTSCVNNNVARLEAEDQITQIEAGLANGNLTYNRSVADDCIGQLQAMAKSCSSSLDQPSSCFVDVQVPTVAKYNNFSVVSGNIQVNAVCGADATTACVAGSACLVNQKMSSYIVPPGETDPTPPTCVSFVGDGQNCLTAPCQPGMMCNSSSVCRTPLPDGQGGCTDYRDCASEDCESAVCVSAGDYTMCGSDMM